VTTTCPDGVEFYHHSLPALKNLKRTSQLTQIGKYSSKLQAIANRSPQAIEYYPSVTLHGRVTCNQKKKENNLYKSPNSQTHRVLHQQLDQMRDQGPIRNRRTIIQLYKSVNKQDRKHHSLLNSDNNSNCQPKTKSSQILANKRKAPTTSHKTNKRKNRQPKQSNKR
jgi:hypothetical protein